MAMVDAEAYQVVVEFCERNGVANIPDMVDRDNCSRYCKRFVCYGRCPNYEQREAELGMLRDMGRLEVVGLDEV